MINEIMEQYQEENFLKADGFDDAIIGLSEDFNSPMRLIYSVNKCLDIIMRDMNYNDAIEHFTFNVSGAYMGEKTPIWCWDNFENKKTMDYKKIDNIEVDGIDTKDYHDFCDAYIVSADYNGKPMNDKQLDEINEDGDFQHECIMNDLH